MKSSQAFWKKYQSIIIQLLVILVTLAVIWLDLIPQLKTYWANRDKADELNQKAQLIQNKVNTLRALDPSQVNDNLTVVLTVLPKDPNVTGAIAQIQNLIALSGLGIVSLGYSSNLKSGAGVDSFQIELKLAGQLQNLNDLLKKLDQPPRIIQVSSFKIQGNSTANDIEIPFSVYFKPPPNGNVPEDQLVQTLTDSDKNLISNLEQGLSIKNVGSASADINQVELGKADPFN